MPTVTDQLENWSIYITLSLRGAEPGFHWGIFVPTEKPKGKVWHAINNTGGWTLEFKETDGIPNSKSLCMLYKIGSVTSQNWATLHSTLGQVPGSGQPSLNTHEEFTCRVWVKDALLALHHAHVIHLTGTIADIEQDAIQYGESNRTPIEKGSGDALVVDETDFSTTS